MQEKKWLIVGFGIGILALIFTIGIFFYQQKQLQALNQEVLLLQAHPATVLSSNSNPNLPSVVGTSSAVPSSSNLIQQQIDALAARLTQVEKKVGLQTVGRQSGPAVKEYIVYLGSGQTDNRDWTDIPSAVATLNSTNYGQLKAVYFEAALSILGGEAHARLKNLTTGEPFYQTEVFHNASASEWETSSAFSLLSGQNSYIVQLRSSSGEFAVLNGSRIHLFLQ